MTGRDFDTDPSTPGAIRGASGADAVATADTEPAVASPAAAKKPHTDPGLGPGVPGSKPPGRQDSVEMLLDGMSAPQPERPKTTPRTEGEAAASYHAEHPVHPARTEPDHQEPKVIVERPPLVPTVKVDRAKLQAVIEQAEAQRRAAEEAAAAQAPVPVTLGPRLLIAAVAGLVVVLVIFLVARGRSEQSETQGTATGATPTATATTAAAATVTATTAVVASPLPVSTDEPAATAPPQPTVTAHVPVTALPVAPAAPKPRPRPTSTSGDLGEFKTTFH